MEKTIWIVIVLISLLLSSCGVKQSGKDNNLNSGTLEMKVYPFSLDQVKLLDGPFKHATDLNEKILLSYIPDRFLARFRTESGLKAKAPAYEGWEKETIAGHSLGHYLSACSQMYLTTGNVEFKNRVTYIVDELKECQDAVGNGYIGASPGAMKIFENEISKGIIKSSGFDLNGLWAPLYTQHKILAGLTDAYKNTGNNKALGVAAKFAEWIDNCFSGLDDNQIQDILNCEFGGINESLLDLYSYTRDDKYLSLAQKLHHKSVIDPITEGKDILAGKHANTQIPKFIGMARLFELTSDNKSDEAAKNFWNMVVYHHSYVTGGNCNHEYFGKPDSLRDRLSQNTTETCNVYNMLKLTEHLFMWKPSAEYADFYEKALFNHILSSQNHENGHVIYNLSLDMGGYKVYEDTESFTCCVGTGMENHSKYNGNIYYHNNEELYVSQYIASELNWKDKDLVLKQSTHYPYEQGTSLLFQCKKPIDLVLNVRYPDWAKKGISIKINDENFITNEQPGSFIKINKKWNNGDLVSISMPFSLRSVPMPDDSNRIALMYGPLVLAGDLGPEDDEHAYEPFYVPVLMINGKDSLNWMKETDSDKLYFKTEKVGNPRDIDFKPFFEISGRRYSVYFDLFTKERWNQYQIEYRDELVEKKRLEERTIDFFQPGEMQPERDHSFKIEKGWIEYLKDKKGRMADRGGSFSFEMKILKDKPVGLWLEFWGGYTGSKTFDILVDGNIISTENITERAPGKFIHLEYSIPGDITKGKSYINVQLIPREGHRAGPLFGARTLKI
ncbi:MAG: glycoside hydrolase family 127 protein [Prolixibacteraceae bacterium]|nr:glycoside hydrolase family 127 protein [Prolixibacteraceae bacterium]